MEKFSSQLVKTGLIEIGSWLIFLPITDEHIASVQPSVRTFGEGGIKDDPQLPQGAECDKPNDNGKEEPAWVNRFAC
jgi:hypothetical protein